MRRRRRESEGVCLASRWFSFAHVVPRKGWWALGVAFRARKLGDKARPEAERAVPRGTQGRKASLPSGTRPPGRVWGADDSSEAPC